MQATTQASVGSGPQCPKASLSRGATGVKPRRALVPSTVKTMIPLSNPVVRIPNQAPMSGASQGNVSHRRHVQTSAAADAGVPSSGGASPTPVLAAVWLSTAFACAGALAFGYHLGIVNGPLEAICNDIGIMGDKSLEGMVVSSTLIGAAVGSLGGGNLSDWLGRRKALLLSAIPMILGPLLSATAVDFTGMAIGRLVTGLAIGLSSSLVPVFVSELAPTAIRGALGTLNQLTICSGILVALLVNVVLPVAQWRDMFMIGVVPGVLLLIGMFLSPESPRWLAANGYEASAQVAARKLWGDSAAAEMDAGASPSSTPKDMSTSGHEADGGGLFSGGNLKPVTIGCMLFAFQQFAGINAIVYFSTSVFKTAGIESGTLASVAVGATNIIGTLIAARMIEQTGRKTLLANSYLGQAAAMFVMAASFAIPGLNAAAGTIAVLGTILYILSFSLGAGPVTALIIPEFCNDKIRGRAVAAAFVAHWVCNVVVGQTFMGAVDAFGLSAVYMGFGVVSVLAALYINEKVPETKGKSFAQIEAEMKS